MYKKSALLISGGGSWGVYGGGTLARIDNNYDTVIGVSTGALLAPFVALNEWDLLKIAYTSVNNDSIFDSFWYKPKPFKNNGNLNKSTIIISLLFGDKTICTSKALKKTIDSFYPMWLHNKLRTNNKEILVGTQNIAEIPSKIHYFSSLIENYDDFKDWMWCSANFPYFTSLVEKGWRDHDGNFHVGIWCDGGLTDLIGFEKLIGRGYTDVDILLHRTKNLHKYEGNVIHSLMDNVITSVNAMRYDIEFDYFNNLINNLNENGTNVKVYWLPQKLSKNPMIFNEEQMLSWWEDGYNSAYDEDRIEIFHAKKKVVKFDHFF